jgi:hypothetical protein
MEGNTPRFYQNAEKNEELESVFSFSVDYDKMSSKKTNSKQTSKRSSFHHHSKCKHKKSKTTTKSKFNLELPEANFNFHSHKEVISKWNILTIQEFLNRNKFKLNNNFDKRNSKKFLSSKEEALEKPFV